MKLHELPEQWRSEATHLRRRYHDDVRANMCEQLATDLESALQQHTDEALTLREAALESGYSENSLRRLVRDGVLINRGVPGDIELRRGDLPRKPAYTPPVQAKSSDVAPLRPTGAVSRRQIARAVASRG